LVRRKDKNSTRPVGLALLAALSSTSSVLAGNAHGSLVAAGIAGVAVMGGLAAYAAAVAPTSFKKPVN
jgi:hypothetical protein